MEEHGPVTPGPGRPPAQARAATTTRSSSSPTGTGRPTTACRSRPTRASWCPPRRTTRPSACGCSSRFFALPAAYAFNSPEERDSILKAAGARRTCRARWWGWASRTREPSPVGRDAPQARPPGRLHRLRGPHRAREGLLAAVRELPPLRAASASPNLNLVLVGKAGAAHPHPRRTSPTWACSPTRTSCPPSGAAACSSIPSPFESLSMALLEAWKMERPGAGQRPLRGAARAGAAGQRRPLLRLLRGVRGDAGLDARPPGGERGHGPRRPRVLRAPLLLGRDHGEVRAAARAGQAGPAAAA